jgi:iron-sulfur cluster assembly protein
MSDSTNVVTPQAEPSSAPGTQIAARSRAATPTETEGVRLTPLAAGKIREYMLKADSPGTQYLFLGVKGGGCSGLSYVLDLRDEKHVPIADTDEVFNSHDVVIVCDLKSYIVGNLTGTEIGFEDGIMGKGFTFKNPNAKQSCGCGSSYSA